MGDSANGLFTEGLGRVLSDSAFRPSNNPSQTDDFLCRFKFGNLLLALTRCAGLNTHELDLR
jgi:hypothetical protein